MRKAETSKGTVSVECMLLCAPEGGSSTEKRGLHNAQRLLGRSMLMLSSYSQLLGMERLKARRG